MSATPEQEGVLTEGQDKGTGGAQEEVLSPRELAMQGLEAGRNSTFHKETGITVQVDSNLDPDANADDIAAEEARKQLEAGKSLAADGQIKANLEDAPKPKVLEGDFAAMMVKRKVDGVEEEISVADLLKVNQKDAAATKRLEEAARTLAEARALQAAARTAAKTGDDDKDKGQTEAQTGVVKTVIKALFEGDEETATKALSELVASSPSSGTQAATLDIDATTAAVEQRIRVKTALQTFQTDYPKLYEDPDLATLSDMQVNREVAAGKPLEEAILSAGAALYAKFGFKKEPGRQEKNADATDRTEKLDRKRERDSVPAATALSASTAEQQQSEEDFRKQSIADLRTLRPGERTM